MIDSSSGLPGVLKPAGEFCFPKYDDERPKGRILARHTNRDWKAVEILALSTRYEVVYRGEGFTLAECSFPSQRSKYSPMIFTSPLRAQRRADKLNELFWTDAFTVRKLG